MIRLKETLHFYYTESIDKEQLAPSMLSQNSMQWLAAFSSVCRRAGVQNTTQAEPMRRNQDEGSVEIPVTGAVLVITRYLWSTLEFAMHLSSFL